MPLSAPVMLATRLIGYARAYAELDAQAAQAQPNAEPPFNIGGIMPLPRSPGAAARSLRAAANYRRDAKRAGTPEKRTMFIDFARRELDLAHWYATGEDRTPQFSSSIEARA